jgi:hypothetical protein
MEPKGQNSKDNTEVQVAYHQTRTQSSPIHNGANFLTDTTVGASSGQEHGGHQSEHGRGE